MAFLTETGLPEGVSFIPKKLQIVAFTKNIYSIFTFVGLKNTNTHK